VTNAQYLVASYFAATAAGAGLALTTYALLRRSFAGLCRALQRGGLGVLLRRLFPLGLVLPALAGLFAVSFRSCQKETYEKIVADRAYLVAKHQEQLAAVFSYLCLALLVWGLLVAVGCRAIVLPRKGRE